MKKLLALLLPFHLAACVTSPPTLPGPGPGPTPTTTGPQTSPAVPYSLSLQGFQISGFPGVHSAVIAGPPKSVVIVGGRRNGLHGFPQGKTASAQPSFPRSQANTTIYVLDLTTRSLLGSASVTSLPTPIANQLQSTNMQGTLLNGWLYLLGGYGPDPQSGALTTLSTATVINYQALVSAVVGGKPLDANFAAANIVQFSHPALAVTGGELELLPDGSGATDFVLAFGQSYVGGYTPGGGLANQVYSDGVRVFQFTYPTGSQKPSGINFIAAIPDPVQSPQTPESPYHRRDYTMKTTVDASGNPRLVSYGGVFKGGRMEGFLNPVFISPGQNGVTLTPNMTNQWMNQYAVASIQLFDKSASTMYTTFFGGISQYYWDSTSNSLKRDVVDIANGIDGLPFINSITTLKMSTQTDTGTQYIHVDQGQTFPPSTLVPSCSSTPAPYGGAETVYVGDPIIQLNAQTAPSVIGYMVGGIAATMPYASVQGTSCASDTIYAVTLNPTVPTTTTELTAPAQ